VHAHDTGEPVMRPMVVQFPDDPACATLDRQYMLGPDILVAPVFSATGTVDFYLPDGRWTHLLSGDVLEGPRWVRATYDVHSVPVFARAGSVVATGSRDDRPDYPYSDGVTLNVFQLADGAEVTTVVPSVDGSRAATFVTTREGDLIRVRRTAAVAAPWSIIVDGTGRIGEGGGLLLATGVDEAEVPLR
jgi:alpha-D-xyloside xylohydrolase